MTAAPQPDDVVRTSDMGVARDRGSYSDAVVICPGSRGE
jgi:hypothetical protein